MIKYFKKKVGLEELNDFYVNSFSTVSNASSIREQYLIYKTDKDKSMYLLSVLRNNSILDYKELYFIQSKLEEISLNIRFDNRIIKSVVRDKNCKLIIKESNCNILRSESFKVNLGANVENPIVPQVKTNTFCLSDNVLNINTVKEISNVKILFTKKIINPINSITLSGMFMTSLQSGDRIIVFNKNKQESNPVITFQAEDENLIIYSNQEYFYDL